MIQAALPNAIVVEKKKTATAPEMVRKVKARLERNPRCSGNQMAKELKISQRSIRRIFQNELKVKPYKRHMILKPWAHKHFGRTPWTF